MEARKKSAQYLREAENNLDDSERDIAATNKLFQRAQDKILQEIDRKYWAAEDDETIMRAYRGMIINVLYGRYHPPGGKAAAALPMTEAAITYYRKRLHHAGATIMFYLAGLDACLQLASDIIAMRLITGHARTADVVLLHKAVDAANEGLQILSGYLPRRDEMVDMATDQRRTLADAFAKISHIYRALGEVDQALLYGSESVKILGKPGCDWNDFLMISGVYADLAEAFMHDPVSKKCFELLSGYFFGVSERKPGELEAVMDAFSKLPDENGQRKIVLQQARKLMAAASDYSHAATSFNLAKNSLFKGQNGGYASSPSLSDAEESLDSPRI